MFASFERFLGTVSLPQVSLYIMECVHYYPVHDIHTGDIICSECGMILTEKTIFEIENPTCFSKSMNETHEIYRAVQTDTIITKRALNRDVLISSKDRLILSKWFNLLNETSFSMTDDIIGPFQALLIELIHTGEYVKHSGPNRRGLVSACVYQSCSVSQTSCPLTGLLSVFDIKSSHFHHGRRALYSWHQKTRLCKCLF